MLLIYMLTTVYLLGNFRKIRSYLGETLTQHEISLSTSQHQENTSKINFNSQYLLLNHFQQGIIDLQGGSSNVIKKTKLTKSNLMLPKQSIA